MEKVKIIFSLDFPWEPMSVLWTSITVYLTSSCVAISKTVIYVATFSVLGRLQTSKSDVY